MKAVHESKPFFSVPVWGKQELLNKGDAATKYESYESEPSSQGEAVTLPDKVFWRGIGGRAGEGWAWG